MAVMYYLNCVVAWLIAIICIAAYFIIKGRTGQRWWFWPITATGWAMFAISHSFILAGVAASEWYMTALRIIGYSLTIAGLVHLLVDKLAKYRQLKELMTRIKP